MEDAIGGFLDSCDEVYVVEQNQSGQISNLINLKFGRHKQMHNILRFDGNLFRPREISNRVMEIRETQSAIVR